MKKFLLVVVTFGFIFALSGCWNGEISVDTVIEKDGSGSRTITLAVLDDTLSTDPIINPDDPDQTEGKGAVINNKHITGGLSEIQTWLDANSPTWMTVNDMRVDGVTRYFELTYSFTDFDDYMAKYKELVNLSPNQDWSDFDETEIPSFVCSGTLKVTCEYKESIDIVNASLDWAINGIYTDIYDEDDLAGYVTKADISTLANYKLTVDGKTVESISAYDAEAKDGDAGTGAVVYPTGPSWTLTTEFTNVTAVIVTGVLSVVVIAGAVVAIIKFKK